MKKVSIQLRPFELKISMESIRIKFNLELQKLSSLKQMLSSIYWSLFSRFSLVLGFRLIINLIELLLYSYYVLSLNRIKLILIKKNKRKTKKSKDSLKSISILNLTKKPKINKSMILKRNLLIWIYH